MAKLTVARVHPLSLAKVLGLLYAAMGLLVGGTLFLISLIGGIAELSEGDGDDALPAFCFAPMVLVLAPFFYGALGFVGGLVAGALYNVAVRFTGGVVIETSACE